MVDGNPTIETKSVAEVRRELDDLLVGVSGGEQRVIVEENGRPVAAIISIRELRLFERVWRRRLADFAALEATGEAFKDIPLEELEREVENALAQVRAENRERVKRATSAS